MTSDVLSYWAVTDMEETAVSWSMTVTVKSPSEDFFSVSHSKIPG